MAKFSPSLPDIPSSQSATKVVAASNASQQVRDNADYLCDGVDDEEEIQEAIDALIATGLYGQSLVLSEGRFNLTSQVVIQNTELLTIKGMGWGTRLGHSGNDELLYFSDSERCEVANLYLHPGALTTAAIYLTKNCCANHFSNIFISGDGAATPCVGVHIYSANSPASGNYYNSFDNMWVRAVGTGIRIESQTEAQYRANMNSFYNIVITVSGTGLVIKGGEANLFTSLDIETMVTASLDLSNFIDTGFVNPWIGTPLTFATDDRWYIIGGLPPNLADIIAAGSTKAFFVGRGVFYCGQPITAPEGLTVTQISPGSDHTGIGTLWTGYAGENLALGELAYLKSDGKFWRTDADAAATTEGLLALATEDINAGDSGTFFLKGFFRDDSWTWTVAGVLYVSPTVGTLTQTAPSTSGQQVRKVGYAYSADVIVLDPDGTIIEVT